jgi:hypothetical protein
VQEVNRLLNQFDQMQGMMKKMKGGGLMKMMKRMGGMGGMGGGGAADFPACRADRRRSGQIHHLQRAAGPKRGYARIRLLCRSP